MLFLKNEECNLHGLKQFTKAWHFSNVCYSKLIDDCILALNCALEYHETVLTSRWFFPTEKEIFQKKQKKANNSITSTFLKVLKF